MLFTVPRSIWSFAKILALVLTSAQCQSVVLCRTIALAESEPMPNILFLVADDQGWNDVGYHNPEMRTPHINDLVRDGVELDCHYVQPQCTPTRVALMTGRYPSRFSDECCQASNEHAFPFDTLTLAKMLNEAGYETGMSGKWHLGSKPEWGPNHHGFDYSHGSLAGAVGMYDHRYRLGSPFAETWHRNHEFIAETGHVTDLTAGEAVGWIEARQQSDTPWFFYVPFHAVHTPLVEHDERWHELNKHIASHDRRLYAAASSHLDHAIGQMIDALERTGQRRDTLIIYTSDNGAQNGHAGNAYPPPDPKLRMHSSNLPLRGWKTQTYEGGYRVPAFVSWPGKLSPRKVTTPMHVVDWLPTLAQLVGYDEELPRLDGVDVWPTLVGEESPQAERTFYIVWGKGRRGEALRHGDWKIVRSGRKGWELFNLADDPNEEHELSGNHPEKLASLLAIYEKEKALDSAK